MGFSDNRGKMSDLNLLPKKHTNFSIEHILLKPAGGESPPPAAVPDHDVLSVSTPKTAKNAPGALPQRSSFPKGAGAATPAPLVATQRPLNRVLDNPWSSRGPLMFDPKLITAGAGPKPPSTGTLPTVGMAGLLMAGLAPLPGASSPHPSLASFPVSSPALAAPSSSLSSSSSSLSSCSSLIKTEVERKVVLSAYANNSVIERNRLSINYPYPVGFFNAYASAAAAAAAATAAAVSSVHYHHNQQQQRPRLPSPATASPTALLPSLATPSLAGASLAAVQQLQHQHHHQQNQQQQQRHHRAAATLVAASTATTSTLAASASALFSSFYQLQKSDENQNSIYDQGSADEASDASGASLCSMMFPEYSFQCAICDKIFGNHDTLLLHEKSHKTPRFECEECGKGFSQLRNYKYHVSVHRGTKEFAAKCPECGKTFNDKGYLSSHLKIHRNKKEYSCPHCPKSFNQRVAFNMHVRIHTGVKPHKCNECGKRFSRKMLLKQHLRTHSGEKPYQCTVCGKSFADRSNMTLHHRLHSGIKPFACPICPKAFTKKHHLKTHLNYHTGYKPYKCPHPNCGQSFTQSSNMRTHAKKCQFKPPNSEFI